ncbi:PAS domain S-box protein [candidate division WWE3 bacterium]|jgi:PAS domain S-box-containing protein|uniref:histidine kinase n=1 Tax=candidate division WWE3 bacterium TaxID=2053526 RepID=A0A3A4ZDR3_UNCKA|nr:MAG: PAS domain S-box protein [candidate division WWE3 bacterium]
MIGNKNLPNIIYLLFATLILVEAFLSIFSLLAFTPVITFILIITTALTSLLFYFFLQFYEYLNQKTKLTETQNAELTNTKDKLTKILIELEEEKQTTEKQKNELLKLELAIANASDPIVITDPDAKIIYANKAVEYITGYTKSEIIGASPALWGKQMSKEFYENMWYTIKTKKNNYHGLVTNKKKSGTKYIAEVHISPVINEKGDILYFVGIERDVTQLKEADRMKTEFISLASHQLRTPLSTMKWYLEMLMNGDVGKMNKEQNDFIKYINKANERMIELVNSLLNVSKIESGKLMVDPVPTDIVMLIEEVVNEIARKIEEKKIQFSMDVNRSVPKTINLDPKMFRQVVSNLLSNSIKYTPDYGMVSIALYTEDKNLVVQVKDNGYGIPAKDQSKLFTKFHRGENIAKMENDGTGLGLYLVKAILDASEGKLWFESEENKGSTFWVSIPLEGIKRSEGDVTLDSY